MLFSYELNRFNGPHPSQKQQPSGIHNVNLIYDIIYELVYIHIEYTSYLHSPKR